MENRPWFTFYDPQVPHHLDYPQVPLFTLLEETARKYPKRPCTILKGAVVTYKEMDELTNRMAAALVSLGIQKGQRVGILMTNIPQFVIAYFSILKAGGVIVAVNPLYSQREIAQQVQDAGVEIMFVQSDFYPTLKKAQSATSLRTLIVTNVTEFLPSGLAFLSNLAKKKKGTVLSQLEVGDVWMADLCKGFRPENRPVLEINAEDVALFQYSGGTTGIPKGAIALHRNLVANTVQFRAWLTCIVEGKDTVLMAIPLFHVYGMVVGMLVAIYAAASMVMIPNPRDLTDILNSVQRYKATLYPGVPTMYNLINQHPDVQAGKYNLSTIKACISGSAPLLQETKARFEALTGGKLVEGYGLSEAPTATHCNPIYGENRSGSIGLPLPDVDCRIVSLDDGATILPPGEIGELIVKSPQVMQGYHNMPEETAMALRDGWLYTGDIARMDQDGYFYIIDRKKELIKPGGYQVWPREVEEVIAMHPKVLEVGVAGVPDAIQGETIKAWIVPKPGETVSAEDITALCKENLASFKVPSQIEFRDSLPRTTVGKILRRELVREHLEKQE
ncbi:MAG: long-chain fatty acid--CoA ligase [Anaerolineales bacterium]|nr:long-chain fatty acid--CoA ligase [Anaerolineales bacterium]